ncbi:DUF692 domain-containing protein [Shewanella intestini]|uniref:DUF692 domain-containing protein n=1 Tax=Shewanella intestini TaxID=2017544 RepID=A0ABS5I389_9GAMM|nr:MULTISPECIES: DUF692 domain-containing protein [Shewanella]MBR9728469.1 DUF692 domain-containing protein [Shewanella intestini]MRG36288.1 DUF692 family protein [Shewanella sp. XMDDZSB0408]
MTTADDFMGFGIGLQSIHFKQMLQQTPSVDWFEVITEDVLQTQPEKRHVLDAIAEQYPLVCHGESLSIASREPLDMNYLLKLKQLSHELNPKWISEHISCPQLHGNQSQHGQPLPYNDDAIKQVVERIKVIQDVLGQQILLENVSSHLSYQQASMDEWIFLSTLAQEADCLLLVDINNIYISARNHNFNPLDYLDRLDAKRVKQFHLEGHSDFGEQAIDTHHKNVPPSVWTLYQAALERFGPVSTMIERSDNTQTFDHLYGELCQAKYIADITLPNHPSLTSSVVKQDNLYSNKLSLQG